MIVVVVVKKTHMAVIALYLHKQRLLSLDMKTKVVQHVPRINLSYFKFQNFKFLKFFFKFSIFSNFQIFSGSQLLSDFQTFFYNHHHNHRAGSQLETYTFVDII